MFTMMTKTLCWLWSENKSASEKHMFRKEESAAAKPFRMFLLMKARGNGTTQMENVFPGFYF